MASHSSTTPSTNDIRSRFLAYFAANGHKEIASSSVVPHDDPTLLFTNAGMNQFKDVFLGKSRRDYRRAVTSQKCVRVGGKHNDLENVGHTTRHLTFFEMLGNFSFGDYFKEDAIRFAWQVATEVFQFEEKKIFPTVFTSDDEAFEIWTKYVPAGRITRMGEKDNFWAMGDTGPCGPCSELYYDRGSRFGDGTNPAHDATGERYIEFWNLVFMQYNRSVSGEMTPLPRPAIDTGAGLERVMSLIMGVDTVFETDVLRSLITAVERISGKRYDPLSPLAPAFRVIADHVRCLAFALADGAQPSNTDRGYVLRKILRRAVRYGRMLGFEKPFLHELLPTLALAMGGQYKELLESEERAVQLLTIEEEGFLRTLKRGGSLLTDVLERAKHAEHRTILGDDAFKLKDTYGLPFEEIQLIAHDSHVTIDVARYQELEQEAKRRSKAAHKSIHVESSRSLYEGIVEKTGSTVFLRDSLIPTAGAVLALLKDGEEVDELLEGEAGELILDQTPFYAEMGGQVGDTGFVEHGQMRALVTNSYSPFKGLIAQVITVDHGQICVGDTVHQHVDLVRRRAIEKNHTATHLLHIALCEVLGSHVRQNGSLVNEELLRFDFSHHKALSTEELQAVERHVNDYIQQNYEVQASEISYEEAQKRKDIKQFFGDKYGSVVRVVEAGPSKELCGGTHTSMTGNIGMFLIIRESSIAAGVRRLEAVSGVKALELVHEKDAATRHIAALLKVPTGKVSERIQSLLEEKESLDKSMKEVQKERLAASIASLHETPSHLCPGYQIVHGTLMCGPQSLKDAATEVLKKEGSQLLLVLGCIDGGKAHLFVRVPEVLSEKLNASTILKNILVNIGGNGGGRGETAQGSGTNEQGLTLAISRAVAIMERGEG